MSKNIIIKSSLYVSLGLFLSRIVGLIRDLIVSAKFGTSETSDLILFLINLPDMLATMLVGTATVAILVPQFINQTKEENYRTYSSYVFNLLSLGILVTVLMYFFPQYFLDILVPGFSLTTQELAFPMVSIAAFSMLFTFSIGAPRAFLQAKEKFNLAAFENLFFSIPLVLAIALLAHTNTLQGLSWAIVGAAFVRAFYLFFCAYREGIRWRLYPILLQSKVIRRFLLLNATSGGAVFIFFYLRSLATEFGPGQLTIYTYFFKFIELPFGILTTIVFTVALPRLAASTNVNNKKNIHWILIVSPVIAFLISAFCYLMQGHDLGFMKLESRDIDQVLQYLIVGAWALPARLVWSYLQSLEYSKREQNKSFIASTIALVFCVLLSKLAFMESDMIMLVWLLNAYYYFSAVILYFLMSQKHLRPINNPM